MTQDQILKMDHLKIAEVKPGMFVHVHAADGYIITAWGEHDDIKDYTGSVCLYMPIRDTYDDDYRTITVAEHEKLETLQRAAIEEMEKEMNRE